MACDFVFFRNRSVNSELVPKLFRQSIEGIASYFIANSRVRPFGEKKKAGMGGPIVAGQSIADVVVEPRSMLADANGAVLRGWRATGSSAPVAEVYCSVVRGGAVKAWKRHRQMTQRLLVPSGRVLFVIYDSRVESATSDSVMEIESGRDAYGLVIIPPMLWYGFAGIAFGESIIVNSPNLIHDPTEIERLDSNTKQIPYAWNVQEGSRSRL